MAVQACLKNAFMEDGKCHNLMRWLKWRVLFDGSMEEQVKYSMLTQWFIILGCNYYQLLYLGDNCIQNVHLGRYIVSYMVGNCILCQRYTSPNENVEYGYPHSNAFFNSYSSKTQYFAPNWSFVNNVKQLRQPITSDVTYDVGAPTIYRRIYWHKFLTLSNQTSCYIRKCIRIKCNRNYNWI